MERKTSKHHRFAWLWSKRGHASKTALWLFAVLLPCVALLWVIVIRLAFLPDELFVKALVASGGVTGLYAGLIGFLYHKGKTVDALVNRPAAPGYEDDYNGPAMPPPEED